MNKQPNMVREQYWAERRCKGYIADRSVRAKLCVEAYTLALWGNSKKLRLEQSEPSVE